MDVGTSQIVSINELDTEMDLGTVNITVLKRQCHQ